VSEWRQQMAAGMPAVACRREKASHTTIRIPTGWDSMVLVNIPQLLSLV
jgi:hypothetical protein